MKSMHPTKKCAEPKCDHELSGRFDFCGGDKFCICVRNREGTEDALKKREGKAVA